MSIQIFFENTNFKFSKHALKNIIKHIIINEGKKLKSISIIICNNDYILDINKRFLKHNYYTDIITFNYCEKNLISGDLFISIEMIEHNSKKFKVSIEEEFHRIVIHGILHLLDYNDKTDEDIKIIRTKEDEYLKLFTK